MCHFITLSTKPLITCTLSIKLLLLILFKVYVLEWNNADWWYVRKHLTEESGWVPAQYLKDEQTYTLYVQKKLVEKIEKLPVFDREFCRCIGCVTAFHATFA